MAALLQVALPHIPKRPLAVYAAALLRSSQPERRSPVPSPLVEPLSAQEGRVLHLLVAGLSNPEIARELVVSVNTIKTQVKSIYRKLDVNDRNEARVAAASSICSESPSTITPWEDAPSPRRAR